MSAKNCKCGGRYVSIDLYPQVIIDGKVGYDTVRINPGYATTRCDKCFTIQKQKLRVSRGICENL
jgi:hypothetical protein